MLFKREVIAEGCRNGLQRALEALDEAILLTEGKFILYRDTPDKTPMKADTDNNAHFNHYYEWEDIIRKRGLVKSKFKGKVIRLGDTLIQHIVNKGKSDKDEGDWRQIIVNFAIATWEDPQEVWQGYKGNHVFVR